LFLDQTELSWNFP